jgi:hypothetical protein
MICTVHNLLKLTKVRLVGRRFDEAQDSGFGHLSTAGLQRYPP